MAVHWCRRFLISLLLSSIFVSINILVWRIRNKTYENHRKIMRTALYEIQKKRLAYINSKKYNTISKSKFLNHCNCYVNYYCIFMLLSIPVSIEGNISVCLSDFYSKNGFDLVLINKCYYCQRFSLCFLCITKINMQY